MLIFARNRKAAERYYKRVKNLLEGKLKLKVNEEKTLIRKLSQTKYLGYGFYHNNATQLEVHKESLKKLKAKLNYLRDLQGKAAKVKEKTNY